MFISKKIRTFDIEDIIKTVKLKLLGHYRYYGVTYNFRGIYKYYNYIRKELKNGIFQSLDYMSISWIISILDYKIKPCA